MHPGRAGGCRHKPGEKDQPFQKDHSLAYCDGVEWKIPAPEIWEAIRKAAMTAGTLMSLRI